MYRVTYRWEDCEEAHTDDQKRFRTEAGAEEQASIHNGLCPHYGVPMRCAVVTERDGIDLDANGEVQTA